MKKSFSDKDKKWRISLKCSHDARSSRRTYKCRITGNYTLELCDNCRKTEPIEFLISEEIIQ